MINQTDIEATLRALLWRFQASSDQGPAQIARFAEAGARALLTQSRTDLWLDSAASGALLGLPQEVLFEQVRNGTLPAASTRYGQPRFHRRDLSLYQMGRDLGMADPHVAPFEQPGCWREDNAGEDTEQLIELAVA
jgi:hypothetical protein